MGWITILAALREGMLLSICALGVFLAFKVANFPDLSIDSLFALGGCVMVTLTVNGWSIYLAIICALVAGTVSGLTTSEISIRLKIHPVIASIIVLFALYSVNLLIMGRPNQSLGSNRTIDQLFEVLAKATGASITFMHVLLIGLFLLILWWLLGRLLNSRLGLALRMAGNNPKLALSMGISTKVATRLTVGLGAGLVALSGALSSYFYGFADYNLGWGQLIYALAAVFIGDVIFESQILHKLFGWNWAHRFGALSAVIIGALIHRIAVSAAYSVGVPASMFNLINAIIVLAILSIPMIKQKATFMFAGRGGMGNG